ncbi:MAG: OmpA family protein [Bacteroidota bacterium]
MFPRLALLPIGLFIIWCFVVSRWYVCHIKQLCGPEDIPVVDTPEPEKDLRPLVFKWDNAMPIPNEETFEAFKNAQIDGLGEGQLLEITGLYYPGENPPDGYTNMGLARAQWILDSFFIPPLNTENVVLSSRLEDKPDGIEDSSFEAALFIYKTPAKPDKVECIVGSNNSLTVLFPYAKATREVDPRVEDCLKDVIQALKDTGGNAQIVGHTDNAGADDLNMRLGRDRAEHIRAILIKNGIDRSKITTDSKGESQPVASNDTDEGRRLNRRAVLTVIEN